MMVLDYYDNPIHDWRFCEKCRARPARWVSLTGRDAEMGVYCSRCLPPGGIVHRYRLAENSYIDLYNKQRRHEARDDRR